MSSQINSQRFPELPLVIGTKSLHVGIYVMNWHYTVLIGPIQSLVHFNIVMGVIFIWLPNFMFLQYILCISLNKVDEVNGTVQGRSCMSVYFISEVVQWIFIKFCIMGVYTKSDTI